MNILFFSYWDVKDPLTRSTVIPHLRILLSMSNSINVVWVNVERNKHEEIFEEVRLKHIPLYSNVTRFKGAIGQMVDFILFPNKINEICSQYNIDLMIARGAPAGALVDKVSKKNGLSYLVESFEPHADYMGNSGTWSRWGAKYYFQKKWEWEQKRNAKLLVTVSNNYRLRLIEEGIDEAKIKVAPCEVDFELFKFSDEERGRIRKEWGWQSCIVGMYVGKFGGIYEEKEAFILFKEAFEVFGDAFRLIILTPSPIRDVEKSLEDFAVPQIKTKVLFVSPEEVCNYISASDFGFVTVKMTETSKYCSAIKVAEYWAMGLPIVIGKDIGDDSMIVSDNEIGVVYNSNSVKEYNQALMKLKRALATYNRDSIIDIAKTYRSSNGITELYASLLKND